MSKGVDRMVAYRTMRAVQKQAEAEQAENAEPEPKTRWLRWQAAVYRIGDKLV